MIDFLLEVLKKAGLVCLVILSVALLLVAIYLMAQGITSSQMWMFAGGCVLLILLIAVGWALYEWY